MSFKVVLSRNSQKQLIQAEACTLIWQLPDWRGGSIQRTQWVAWLKTELFCDKKSRLLLESLRAAILRDVGKSFLPPNESRNLKIKKRPGWRGWMQFWHLVIAGTILALCQGFDGITSILGLFSSLPTILIFGVGLTFALFSVVVFYAFDLVEISKNIGLKVKKSHQLLDVLLAQADCLNKIAQGADDHLLDVSDPEELDSLSELLEMLVVRYRSLSIARDRYKKNFDEHPMQFAKGLAASIVGILYFGGGFFAGQSLGIAVTGLFTVSAVATFWPVVMTSMLAGIAALSVYWFLERPGIENLVGRWFGMDKDKVGALSDAVDNHEKSLAKLKRGIVARQEISDLRRFATCLSESSAGTGCLRFFEREPSPNPIEVDKSASLIVSAKTTLPTSRALCAGSIDVPRPRLQDRAHEPRDVGGRGVAETMNEADKSFVANSMVMTVLRVA